MVIDESLCYRVFGEVYHPVEVSLAFASGYACEESVPGVEGDGWGIPGFGHEECDWVTPRSGVFQAALDEVIRYASSPVVGVDHEVDELGVGGVRCIQGNLADGSPVYLGYEPLGMGVLPAPVSNDLRFDRCAHEAVHLNDLVYVSLLDCPYRGFLVSSEPVLGVFHRV